MEEPLDEDHNGVKKDEVPYDDKDTKNGQTEVEAIEPAYQKQESIKTEEPREEENMMKQSEMKRLLLTLSSQDKNTRSHTDEVVALGKNASFYLNSMKKIMENV